MAPGSVGVHKLVRNVCRNGERCSDGGWVGGEAVSRHVGICGGFTGQPAKAPKTTQDSPRKLASQLTAAASRWFVGSSNSSRPPPASPLPPPLLPLVVAAWPAGLSSSRARAMRICHPPEKRSQPQSHCSRLRGSSSSMSAAAASFSIVTPSSLKPLLYVTSRRLNPASPLPLLRTQPLT